MISLDVGNTSLQFVLFKDGGIKKTFKLPTFSVNKKIIKKALANYKNEDILVCSVVPRITKLLKDLKSTRIVGRDIKVPIKCLYAKNEIGSDRLVAAYAAKKLFPKTRFVLDFGTAITLDFLSYEGAYQGGLILPGIGSTLKVFASCALLPKKVSLRHYKILIPKTTLVSINKGVEEGFSCMVNALIAQYKRKLDIKPADSVILTGGEASIVMSKINFSFEYEPFLVPKGLWMLYKENISC